MDSATADQCLAVLDRAGPRAAVMSSLLEAVQRHLTGGRRDSLLWVR